MTSYFFETKSFIGISSQHPFEQLQCHFLIALIILDINLILDGILKVFKDIFSPELKRIGLEKHYIEDNSK